MTVISPFPCDFAACVFMLSVRFILISALPWKDSCLVVGPEIPDYQVQGEAVFIRFPFLEDAIRYRKLRVDNSSSFFIDHSNPRNQSSLKNSRDRVRPSGRGLVLLPCHVSDSGTYTYVLRSATFCLTGSISLTVHEPRLAVMRYMAHAGQDTSIVCPHLKYFRRTENPKWYKDFQSSALPVDTGRYAVERGIVLLIKNISLKDEGFYTCRLSVVFNSTRYNVSRTWRVWVSDLESVSARDLSISTAQRRSFPYIVSPVNGSVVEGRSGSGLVVRCVVSSGRSTDVTWLIEDQPLGNSHMGGRAVQTDRSTTDGPAEVQLEILELQEEDHGTELKCVSQNHQHKHQVVTTVKLTDPESLWFLVAASSSCFIIMVCVFMYHLCQMPQKPADYVLAQQ